MAVRCPKCSGKLLQRTGDTTRLRTEGIHTFDASGNCTARCYWCKEEIPVPIQLLKTVAPEPERLVVAKGLTGKAVAGYHSKRKRP